MIKRIGVFTLAALFTTGAFAMESPVAFTELDTDDDGVIGQQEAKGSKLEQHFKQADQDSDGNVSPSEFEAYQQKDMQKQGGGQQQGGQQ